MKPARIFTATVAMAALSTLGLAATALAGVPRDDHGAQPVTRPADPTRAQRTLQRTLAREHHADPARTDQQALERGRAADAARWQAQADAWDGSNTSRRRSVVVMAGDAQARKPNQEPGADPAARPADPSPAQQMLVRTLARERNTYPAPPDQAGQAAELALTRTLAREQQPSPAADDAPQPAQTRPVDRRRILSALGVIATTAVVAMTWRRRARSRLRERA